MKENQRMYAAAARSRGAFCIAVVEPDVDDPYAFVLSYDATFPQPWARVDARRIINSITVAASPATYAALSNEGDVYLLEAQRPVTERIPGAGTFSMDATGLGSATGITEIAGALYVCGDASQLYRRDGPGAWSPLAGGHLAPGPGFSSLRLGVVAGLSPHSIYVCGSATPARRQLTAADYKEMEEAGKRGDTGRIVEIMNSTKDVGVDYTYAGMAFFWNGIVWNRIALPDRHPIHDILIEAPDRIWLTGFNGTILRGDAAAGFQNVGFHGDTETILSFTKFGARYVAASDNALHWFNGHNLSPMRPTTLSRIATPLKVQAVGDVLFYFDYNHGVHRFDGKVWQEIVIPPELLERNFKGLAPRGP
jgi:hypothetical protein